MKCLGKESKRNMKDSKTGKEKVAGYIYYLSRVAALLSVVLIFLPACNPAKICDYVNKNMSLFTSGVAYGDLTKLCVRAFDRGWVQESSFVILFIGSLITCIGILGAAAMGCMSLGNNKLKRLGNWFGIGGAALHLIDYLRIMWKEMRKNERLQRGRPAESCLRHRRASRGSVIVSFLFGAAIFHEKNLKAKFVDLLLVLLGMLFLYFGTK